VTETETPNEAGKSSQQDSQPNRPQQGGSAQTSCKRLSRDGGGEGDRDDKGQRETQPPGYRLIGPASGLVNALEDTSRFFNADKPERQAGQYQARKL